MDKLRISELNKINIQIKDNNINIERLQKQLDTSTRINEITDENKFLSEKRELVRSGKYDMELTTQQEKAIVRSDNLTKQHNKIKEERREEKDRQNNYFKKNYTPNRKFINHKERDYNIYMSIINTIPKDIKKNLKTMPCNSGYIWRGIHLYGEKKAKGHGLSLFERKKDCLLTHKWEETRYKIYKKDYSTNKKKMIENKPRKVKKSGMVNLGDFVN